jgi:hypothetical protein
MVYQESRRSRVYGYDFIGLYGDAKYIVFVFRRHTSLYYLDAAYVSFVEKLPQPRGTYCSRLTSVAAASR